MKTQRSWSDAQLAEAVSTSSSWRGVMRTLGLNPTSAGAIRIVRAHATRLGLDSGHFRGKRGWSDSQLRRAVLDARSWDEVLTTLGLSTNSGNARTHVKSHALRLGLSFGHLESGRTAEPEPTALTPDLRHLREAGPAIAASWFTLCGCSAMFPIEPASYDLVVSAPDGLKRVQVKTTTSRNANGWQVGVARRPYSVGRTAPRVPYDAEVIDLFFILDGDLTMYVIPSRIIGGRVGLQLRNYGDYVVGNAGGLLRQGAAGHDDGRARAFA